MKRLIIPALLPLCLLGETVAYDLSMTLHVPAVVDNMESQGKRVYRTQRLKGTLTVETTDWEPEIRVDGLVNRSHSVGGRNVTYETEVDRIGWHVIGSNRTGVFRKPSVFLSMEATPSYALADGEDDTLLVTMSGSGRDDRTIQGYVAGQLGCGCRAYGHVSPTRIMWNPGAVPDTASVWGTWKAKRRTTAPSLPAETRKASGGSTRSKGDR